MQKRIVYFIAIVVAVAFLAYPAFGKGHSRPSGNSHIGQLYLYEKVPSGDTNPEDGDCPGMLAPWEIVEGGAWGKLTYTTSGETFDFLFNGHGLPGGVSYTLIYYPDDWTFAQGGNIICLASGITNRGGNIHLSGSVDPGDDLPITGDQGDCNYGYDGAKIWLVLSDDLTDDCVFNNWGPTAYLFEDAVIFFDYPDPDPAP
ncbi:MAG: hypothetical protein JRK53_11730 [Deltaproteobacteria bacterium]|nr:hypothetical protein [Deltaproteobacteria bacterium]MBW1817529.1 hypothetical protein [Deltaproteobacteria bacterium]